MKIKHLLARGIALASTLALTSVMAASPVFAKPTEFNKGVYVYDKFNHMKTLLQPAEGSYWWIDGQGTLPDGTAGRVRAEDNCDLQTCVSIIEEDGNGFVRIQGFPSTTTVNYTNANLAEEVDGADGDPVYDGQTYPGPWNPSATKSVTLEARARFGPNFNKDGTGGAKGTAGIWLWNNPFSLEAPNPYAIYDGIGFSWISNDSEILNGLNMTVTKGAFPVFAQPVTANINIQDWNTYKFVWAQDILGNQTVTYYINGQFQAVAPMFAGFTTMQNMGLEVWLDNSAFKPSEFPDYLKKIAIPEERHFDLDYVKIQKN